MAEKWFVTRHPIRILSHYAVRVRDYSVRYADRDSRVCVRYFDISDPSELLTLSLLSSTND